MQATLVTTLLQVGRTRVIREREELAKGILALSRSLKVIFLRELFSVLLA